MNWTVVSARVPAAARFGRPAPPQGLDGGPSASTKAARDDGTSDAGRSAPVAPARRRHLIPASVVVSNADPSRKEQRTMRATWNGITLAESDDTGGGEGKPYYPPGT